MAQKEDFAIDIEKFGGTSKFRVKGPVNSTTVNHLEHKLNESFRDGRNKVVVNMAQVTFLSSAGIRILLAFYKRAKKEGGSFSIEDPTENVMNVLGMTALDEMLVKR